MDLEEIDGSQPVQSDPPPMSFLERLLSIFFGGDNPERERKRRLKQIAKQISRTRYKFYKPRTGDALPGVGRFFFEIYRVIGPAQKLLQNAGDSAGLRGIVIDRFLTDEQLELKSGFEEQAIRERAGNTGTRELAAQLKDDMIAFFGTFDGRKVKEINATYNRLKVFLNFVNFDYYFLLKKFDSSFMEDAYERQPKLDTIRAEYLSDDIKDFLEVLFMIDKDANWDPVLDVLRVYRNIDVVDRQKWSRIVNIIDEVRRSDILLLMVQHIDGDPYYKPTVKVPNERIVEDQLNKLKAQTEATVNKILNERRNGKIEALTKKVFGTTAVSRARNYTEKANLMFNKKMMGGFVHTSAFNYLKAFLIDYFKKDIREVVRDLFIVRGTWGNNSDSHQLSEAFHETMKIAGDVVSFDDGLGDEGELGTRLRKLMGRVVERDNTTQRPLRQYLDELNSQVQRMITQTAQHLIHMAKYLKALIQDYEASTHEMVINWRELDAGYEGDLKGKMVEMYQTIYYFVQLLQIYVKK